MPHARNVNFTGRDDILTQLRANLTSGVTTALTQAIRGLGGIGKTQTAIEYAYRHEHDYTHVLWINADTSEVATSSMAEIARILGLEANSDDRGHAVVKRWLAANSGYLLILDNADDIKIVPTLLPMRPGGHVIVTTRAVAMSGIAQPIEIPKLDQDDGASLLLQRANINATDDDRAAAREVAIEMDGLPLALDQAGAYIEETGTSPRTYLDLYIRNRGRLLARNLDMSATDHNNVAVTYGLALEKVEKINPAAGDLIRLCANLAPEPIPMAILTKGAPYLGDLLGAAMSDPLTRNETIAAAYKWSLLQRDRHTDTIILHRVVQDVVKEAMSVEEIRIWRKRTVDATDAAFSEDSSDAVFPHVLVCFEHIIGDDLLSSLTSGRHLLDMTGKHFRGYPVRSHLIFGRFKTPHNDGILRLKFSSPGSNSPGKSSIMLRLAACEKVYGPEHPETASALNDLASEFASLNEYTNAEPLYRRALGIREKVLGPGHPDTEVSLCYLADILDLQGNYVEAESLYRRAFARSEMVSALESLAVLLRKVGRVDEAVIYEQRAVASTAEYVANYKLSHE